MTTTKPDEVGYYVHVGTDEIKVFKMKFCDFHELDVLAFIKTMLGAEGDNSAYLEGVYKQFADPTIDIFVDADGIGKGYPALATTNKGLILYGNFVALGNNEGDTVLLTQTQAQMVITELGFYKDYGGVGLVDTTGASEYLAPEDHPEKLRKLLGMLVDYCVHKEVQLLTLASNPYDPSEGALIMCVHGEPEFIAECHKVVRKFVEGKDRIIN